MDINSLKVLYTSVPGRYALALFNEGKKSNCLDDILENFDKLETFFKHNQSIKKLLTSRCISEKDLDAGWLSISGYLSFCPVFMSFLRQVGRNRRFNILHKIRHIYRVALAKHKNRRRVAITSAVDLLPEQKDKIKKVVESMFSEKTIMMYKVNPAILGGIIVASEEKIYDASIRNRLQQIAKFLRNTRIEQI
ncbi:MAG: ATP synthase F1 subunit delta [Holosporales bacterium]|nr:ATP synthase F1 subunit delta [Holosporales bacterium]